MKGHSVKKPRLPRVGVGGTELLVGGAGEAGHVQ